MRERVWVRERGGNRGERGGGGGIVFRYETRREEKHMCLCGRTHQKNIKKDKRKLKTEK